MIRLAPFVWVMGSATACIVQRQAVPTTPQQPFPAVARAQISADSKTAGPDRTQPPGQPALPTEERETIELIAAAIQEGDRDIARELLTQEVATIREPRAGTEEAHVAFLLELDGLAKTLGSLELSRELLESVVALLARTLPPEHLNLLKAKQKLAATRFRLGDLAGAREIFEQVLETWTRVLPANDPDRLRAQGNLAVACKAMGDLAGARDLFEKSLAAWVSIAPSDHPDLIMAKQNLASTKYDMGDIEGARLLCEEVLTVRSHALPADHPDLLTAKQNLAVIRKALGDAAGARQLEEETLAAQVRLLPADHPDLLRAKAYLAVTRREFGDLEGALGLEEEVLEAQGRRLPPDHPDLLAAKQNIAITLRELGELTRAIALEEEVLATRTHMLPPDHPDLLTSKQNLAVSRKNLGDLVGAQELEEEVLSIRTRLLPGDHVDVLRAKGNLAVTRKKLGDFMGARELEEEVLIARERQLPPDHPDLLWAKSNLANTLSALGDLKGSRRLEEEVVVIREQFLADDLRGLINAKQNLAVTRAALGDLQGARELFEELLAAGSRLWTADNPDLITVKQNLAVTCRQGKDLTRAHELFGEVLASWSRILPSQDEDLLSARQNLAVTSKELGDFDRASQLLSDLLDGIRARARGLRLSAPRPAREGSRAELQRLSAILFLCSAVEREHELEPRVLAAIENLRFASVSSSEIAQLLAAHPELEEEASQVRGVRSQLGDLVTAGPATDRVGEWHRELLALAEERDRGESRLRRKLAESGAALDEIDVGEVGARLEAGAAAVSFFRYSRHFEADPLTGVIPASIDSLLAFLLKPDGSVTRIELGPAAELEESVEAWRSLLGRPLETRGIVTSSATEDRAELEALGTRLRRRILDPVLARAGGVQALHVVLDDVLYLLPLDALPFGNGFVGDSLAIRNEVTLARLLEEHRPFQGDRLLVLVGGLDYDAEPGEGVVTATDAATPPIFRSSGPSEAALVRFQSLPGTSGEVEAIARLHDDVSSPPALSLQRAEGTKRALLAAARDAQWLHIATHGWFARDEVRSHLDTPTGVDGRAELRLPNEALVGFAPETLCGLALAGANRGRDALGRVPGILTAEELATFDLRKCELAVLSACETNVGIRRAGQGIQSLQSALHAAGARSAITSLWKVDDAATRRLFELFYTKLWKERLGKAEALWQAKMALRAEGHALRDWAGWVLTGDPD